MTFKNGKFIRKGIGYGIKTWIITGFISPLIIEMSQIVHSYDQGGYEIGDLWKIAPIIYFMLILTILIFFLIPSVLSGLILSLTNLYRTFKPAFSALILSLFVTFTGYGSLWILFLSKADYMKNYSYWIECLSMFGVQFILWLWIANKQQQHTHLHSA